MPDYNEYISRAGITGTAFTRAVHEKYPGFSKIGKSMVCNPDRYGVQLLPDAEAHLVETFGDHPGLSGREPSPVKVKAKPARTKPNRLVVYLPDETNERLRALMERRGYSTVQEFLYTILTNLVRIEEKRKENSNV